MITTRIPILSPSSGNDGIVRGRINQSNSTAVLMGTSTIQIVEVLRKDVTPNGALWTDVTTSATDANASDFNPFGLSSNMSSGDAFYFRTINNIDTNNIYVQIATTGVGNWGLEIQDWNSTTDTWENNSGLVDLSNAFRAGTGTYKISYNSGAKGLVRLDDSKPKYIWHKVVLTNFVSVTTAPIISRIWCAVNTLSYLNITTAYTTGAFTSIPSDELPRTGDCLLIVHPNLSMGIDLNITTPASTNYNVQWQYLATNETYKNLTDVTDFTTNYTTSGKIRWTIPNDWTPQSITDNSGAIHTGYITIKKIVTISIEGPVAPPHATLKTRCFGIGNASGIYHRTDTVYNTITFFAGTSSTSITKLSFINNINGNTQTISIPANTSSSGDITNGRLDFTSSLNIGAGEQLLILCLSGGTLSDVEIMIQ